LDALVTILLPAACRSLGVLGRHADRLAHLPVPLAEVAVLDAAESVLDGALLTLRRDDLRSRYRTGGQVVRWIHVAQLELSLEGASTACVLSCRNPIPPHVAGYVEAAVRALLDGPDPVVRSLSVVPVEAGRLASAT
jgi:hypothetical protein